MTFLLIYLMIPSTIPQFLADGWRNSLTKNDCSSIVFYFGRLKKTKYSFSKEDLSRVNTCVHKLFPLKITLKNPPIYQANIFKLNTYSLIPESKLITIPSGLYYMGFVPNLRPLAVRLAKKAGIKIDKKDLHFSQWGRLSSFRIMSREVSVDEFRSGKLGKNGKPVSNISFKEASDFCKRVNGQLPDEHQFEAAASGGEYFRAFTWGESIPVACEGKNICIKEREDSDTSVMGVRFLGTGVSEFVRPTFFRSVPTGKVIIKGGSSKDPWVYGLTAFRRIVDSTFKSGDTGFRCVFPVRNK
ncbi:SUMF1/EgtB/PvdO family nonheme iron enzyme [Myxococcota bacterium]|nr:SUMF1/EgtB/PvdO family nonheme iron enzyme [Myxococcota bacterium]MBU1379545.1 SUMF1/EgtB/PvdO family nonheme iron enzyme [Myxococcota bacterium]MBU1495263.1 SUMF1/EgtB/PvdO family nonheme iron enzyme [Myxococcota bacterium]